MDRKEIAHQEYQKVTISRTLDWFSNNVMKTELEKHLDRPGWKNESIPWLFGRLLEEVAELAGELFNKPKISKEKVIKESAHVSNFAMMIANNCDRE